MGTGTLPLSARLMSMGGEEKIGGKVSDDDRGLKGRWRGGVCEIGDVVQRFSESGAK